MKVGNLSRKRTNKGSKFVYKEVDRFLKEEGVAHFTQNKVKANITQKAIKPIEMRLSRFATKKHTYRWIGVLPRITKSYNTHHRSIKQTFFYRDLLTEKIGTKRYETNQSGDHPMPYSCKELLP